MQPTISDITQSTPPPTCSTRFGNGRVKGRWGIRTPHGYLQTDGSQGSPTRRLQADATTNRLRANVEHHRNSRPPQPRAPAPDVASIRHYHETIADNHSQRQRKSSLPELIGPPTRPQPGQQTEPTARKRLEHGLGASVQGTARFQMGHKIQSVGPRRTLSTPLRVIMIQKAVVTSASQSAMSTLREHTIPFARNTLWAETSVVANATSNLHHRRRPS